MTAREILASLLEMQGPITIQDGIATTPNGVQLNIAEAVRFKPIGHDSLSLVMQYHDLECIVKAMESSENQELYQWLLNCKNKKRAFHYDEEIAERLA